MKFAEWLQGSSLVFSLTTLKELLMRKNSGIRKKHVSSWGPWRKIRKFLKEYIGSGGTLVTESFPEIHWVLSILIFTSLVELFFCDVWQIIVCLKVFIAFYSWWLVILLVISGICLLLIYMITVDNIVLHASVQNSDLKCFFFEKSVLNHFLTLLSDHVVHSVSHASVFCDKVVEVFFSIIKEEPLQMSLLWGKGRQRRLWKPIKMASTVAPFLKPVCCSGQAPEEKSDCEAGGLMGFFILLCQGMVTETYQSGVHNGFSLLVHPRREETLQEVGEQHCFLPALPLPPCLLGRWQWVRKLPDQVAFPSQTCCLPPHVLSRWWEAGGGGRGAPWVPSKACSSGDYLSHLYGCTSPSESLGHLSPEFWGAESPLIERCWVISSVSLQSWKS